MGENSFWEDTLSYDDIDRAMDGTWLPTDGGLDGQFEDLWFGTRTVSQTNDAPADYKLLEMLGEGGDGTVWSARQSSLDRKVAIKKLNKHPNNGELKKRAKSFFSEAALTAALEHPNIVPIYDLMRNDVGAVFYSMQLVNGPDWSKLMHDGGRTLEKNIEVLKKVCDAIRFAHSRGVVHCDIKPRNIVVGEFGEVWVIDWGIAMRVDIEKDVGISRDRSLAGTPAYMAPEQAGGAVSLLTDVYLLGAVLFEIISGKPPHPEPQRASDLKEEILLNEILQIVTRNEILPIEQSGALVDIAYKAMATDPNERFQSVKEFQDAVIYGV